jgi:hypothetical protein
VGVLEVDAGAVAEDLRVLHVHDDEAVFEALDDAVAVAEGAADDGPRWVMKRPSW